MISALLLYDLVNEVYYNMNCFGANMQSNLMGTNAHRIVTNTLRRETVTKW